MAAAAIVLTVAVPVVIVDLTQGWYRLVALNARAYEADVVVRARSSAHGLRDTAEGRAALLAVAGVQSVAPFVESWAILSRSRIEGLEGNIPCQVQGIEWQRDAELGRVAPSLLHPPPVLELRAPPLTPAERGTGFVTPGWRALTALAGLHAATAVGGQPCALPPAPRPRAGIVCGRELLYPYGMRPGEVIQLAVPNGTGGTIGRVTAEISDTIGTGVLEIDRSIVLAPLPLAQRLAGLHARPERAARVSGYRLATTDDIDAVAAAVERATGLAAYTWLELRGNTVKMMEIQRNLFTVSMIAVQLLTVFVVYAVFSTMVAELRHDLGVLRGLGARRRDLAGAFLIAGTLCSVLGGLLGWALSWGVLAALNPLSDALGFALFPESVFYTPQAPTSFDAWIPLLFIASMTTIGLAAVLVPAWRATRIEPIAVIREGAG
ncbi:MAG: FtsX-like permease family protein [Planctomycetota bacterium]|nr:FtsX-like permease family protein [Planctomycetota bacterium]MDW8372109.1 FtsX-like permease family protein [Planctomycetota bacterium]